VPFGREFADARRGAAFDALGDRVRGDHALRLVSVGHVDAAVGADDDVIRLVELAASDKNVMFRREFGAGHQAAPCSAARIWWKQTFNWQPVIVPCSKSPKTLLANSEAGALDCCIALSKA
jgi:hypothetical protein